MSGVDLVLRCDVVLTAASAGDLAASADDVGDGALGGGGVAADRAVEGGAAEQRRRERALGRRGQRGHHQDSGESRVSRKRQETLSVSQFVQKIYVQ